MNEWLAPMAYAGVALLGLCLLTVLLWLALAATEGRRLTVRGWLALAWLATLIIPALVEGATLLIYTGLQSFASSADYQLALTQQREVAQVIAPVAAFLVTMSGIVWLTGRMVLRPLAAMDEAARSIASGNLEIAVEAPPLREVAEVADAFYAMSAALRESIERQADLEQERRLFVSAIAHDLRTPLFSLRGYLEGLERNIADTPAKRARYLRICREQADALESLVADLFMFAQLDYLEQEPRRAPMDLGETLSAVAEAARPQAEMKGITLALATEGQVCRALADRRLIERAARNLLDNALRYTPAGGTVRIHWRVEDGMCVFSVRDSGPGFGPEDLARLFSPLYRGDASRNSKSGGAGLGLAIARRILLAHGGALRAFNARDGGAELTGDLPVASQEEMGAASMALRASAETSERVAGIAQGTRASALSDPCI